jgi:hypothetical protein
MLGRSKSRASTKMTSSYTALLSLAPSSSMLCSGERRLETRNTTNVQAHLLHRHLQSSPRKMKPSFPNATCRATSRALRYSLHYDLCKLSRYLECSSRGTLICQPDSLTPSLGKEIEFPRSSSVAGICNSSDSCFLRMGLVCCCLLGVT